MSTSPTVKVLITSNLYKPNIGGIENSLYYFFQAARKNNDKAIILSSNINLTNEPKYRSKERAHFEYNVPATKLKFLKNFLHIYRAILLYFSMKRKFNPDFVIARFHFNVLICKLCRLKKINYVVPGVMSLQYSPKDMDGVQEKFHFFSVIKFKLHTFMQRIALLSADKVFVFSINMRNQIKEIAKEIEPILIEPGVDHKKFLLSEPLETKNIELLIVARLVQAKGISFAIKALRLLPGNYKLTIVGDGPEMDNLQSLTKQQNLSSRVKFTGSSNCTEIFYRKSHIFLLPSIYEAFGQTILEASISGLPVVAFDSRIVKTATNSILKEFGAYADSLNETSYAQTIEKAFKRYYIDKSTLRCDLRNYVLSIYSWCKAYEKIKKANF